MEMGAKGFRVCEGGTSTASEFLWKENQSPCQSCRAETPPLCSRNPLAFNRCRARSCPIVWATPTSSSLLTPHPGNTPKQSKTHPNKVNQAKGANVIGNNRQRAARASSPSPRPRAEGRDKGSRLTDHVIISLCAADFFVPFGLFRA